MPDERIRPPGWLEPMNKLPIALLRRGLPIFRHEATLTEGRRSERVRMVELAAAQARPVLRAFPTAAPTGVQLMKRAGVLIDGSRNECAGMAGRLAVFRIDPIT